MTTRPSAADPATSGSTPESTTGTAHDDTAAATESGAPRSAWALSTAVVVGFFLTQCQLAYSRPFTLAESIAVITCLVLQLILQLLVGLWFGRPDRRAAAHAALAAHAVLVLVPSTLLPDAWMGVPGYLAGSVLLVLSSPAAAWTAFAAVIAAVAIIHGALSPVEATAPGGLFFAPLRAAVIGLIVFGLTRFRKMVVDLHEARTALAEASIVRERLRFARDLHDLLGYSLAALTLKAELAHHLIPRHHGRAQGEVNEILDIGRQALADVRSVADGYRNLSLEEECRSVRAVLTTAGVQVRMRTEYGHLPTQVSTVIATVLREGATNLLRHSKAENCAITIREVEENVEAEMVNDGASATSGPGAGGSSSGLENLATRAEALGGGLTHGSTPDGVFRVAVVLPRRPDTAALRAARGQSAGTAEPGAEVAG
ncbi:sensor histidine kinase [Streptomonospora litoralis]|uniref:Sensor histidine kinase DesK n=1 Tax=Streptomonospora litoralis TaxID=2498135 RepID=A0A4P6Q429_9ACTN|nr:histidine kinase [Streptomonospora litoralis]QBI55458.1 Sensor histidine kinase DesK [Streptomonospora litoralis]